jgi:hypothetical protein
VQEALLSYPKESFVPHGFRFLCFYITKKPPAALSQLCMTRIRQHYWSFTQKRLVRTYPIAFHALGRLFSQITTDIVSSDILSTDSILESLRLCFDFYSRQSTLNQRPLTGPLLLLCPQQSLRIAINRHYELSQADVEALMDRTKSPVVMGRCIAYFAGPPPDAIRARIDTIVRAGPPHRKLALVIVRAIAATDRAAAVAAAERFLAELPAGPRNELAVKLFPLEALGMRDALLRQFPFLGLDAAPEDALRWFAGHPIAQWPLHAGKEFAKDAFAFLARAPGRIRLGDVEDLDLRICILILKNKDVFAAADVRRLFAEKGGSAKLRKLRVVHKIKPFRQIAPIQGIPLAPTAAPSLRKGVVLDSAPLIASFLAHSPVVIGQAIFNKIVQNYPSLADAARKYAERCGLKIAAKPPDVDIQSMMAKFCVKGKFLREICRTAESGPQIEILRMLLFQQLARLSSPKKWFYFLRFIRLSLVVDDKKSDGYRRNTREWMKDILAASPPESESVVTELCRLLQALFPADALRQYADQHPILGFNLYRTFQEGDSFTEVPSLILDIVAHHTQYPYTDVIRLLDDRKGIVLSVPVMAETVITFLMENPTYLLHPETYLPALVDPMSAIFVAAAPFTVQLFSQCPSSLPNFEFAITAIRVGNYSASAAVPISAAYYQAMAKASASPDLARRLQMQGVLQLTELFLLNPSAASCKALSEAVADTLKFFDSVSLLLGRLFAIDSRFVWLLALTNRYLAVAGDAQRSKFIAQLGDKGDLVPKSRKIAMLKLTQRRKQEAFALGLAETDDDTVIDRVTRELRS